MLRNRAFDPVSTARALGRVPQSPAFHKRDRGSNRSILSLGRATPPEFLPIHAASRRPLSPLELRGQELRGGERIDRFGPQPRFLNSGDEGARSEAPDAGSG